MMLGKRELSDSRSKAQANNNKNEAKPSTRGELLRDICLHSKGLSSLNKFKCLSCKLAFPVFSVSLASTILQG